MVQHICPKCEASFDTKAQLNKHLQKKNPCDKGFPCNICGKNSKTAETRRKHQKKCKGPKKTLEGVQAELEEVKNELADRSAAEQQRFGLVNNASAVAAQQVINNITNVNVTNNYTINTESLHIHNSIGHECKAHLKGVKIRITENPKVFADWYKLLREPCHNHNVLLPFIDSKEALICLGNVWEKRDVQEAIMMIIGADSSSLYDHVGNRYPSDDALANSFRYDYLAQHVMQMASNKDTNGLKDIIKTYIEQVVETSQQYLVPVQNEQAKLPGNESLTRRDRMKANDDAIAQVLKKITINQNEFLNLQQQLHMLTESNTMLRNEDADVN